MSIIKTLLAITAALSIAACGPKDDAFNIKGFYADMPPEEFVAVRESLGAFMLQGFYVDDVETDQDHGGIIFTLRAKGNGDFNRVVDRLTAQYGEPTDRDYKYDSATWMRPTGDGSRHNVAYELSAGILYGDNVSIGIWKHPPVPE